MNIYSRGTEKSNMKQILSKTDYKDEEVKTSVRLRNKPK